MLEALIRQEIEETGPLSQRRFMELALQHPKYGYYRTQEAIAQDFTTSPEISQIFGELLGIWAVDYYHKLQEPLSIDLIELGPGKGTLMSDFLRASNVSKSFLEALKLYVVEINPLLQNIQKKQIRFPFKQVERFEDILSSQNPLIIIANEFFDGMPSEYFVRKNHILYKRYVSIEKKELAFRLHSIAEDKGIDADWEESPDTEVIMNQICIKLQKQRGVFLCIDYGYEKGGGDSLQCLSKGVPSNPFLKIGSSDLSCHVNFGRLKDVALSHGLGVLGPIPQGIFLKNIGFDIRIKSLKQNNPLQRASLEAVSVRLTHPQQMGSLFKAMAVFSPSTVIPTGFTR